MKILDSSTDAAYTQIGAEIDISVKGLNKDILVEAASL